MVVAVQKSPGLSCPDPSAPAYRLSRVQRFSSRRGFLFNGSCYLASVSGAERRPSARCNSHDTWETAARVLPPPLRYSIRDALSRAEVRLGSYTRDVVRLPVDLIQRGLVLSQLFPYSHTSIPPVAHLRAQVFRKSRQVSHVTLFPLSLAGCSVMQNTVHDPAHQATPGQWVEFPMQRPFEH